MDNNFYRIDDLPDPDINPDLWKLLDDPNLPKLAVALILNVSREYKPELLNDAQCRTQLAKIKAYQELIDLPAALRNPPITTSSDIPEEFE